MKTVCSVVGARPNFMKVALLHGELERRGLRHVLVHTGQHYDQALSEVFFKQLRLPAPDYHLGVGSGRHGEMTGKTLMAFEAVCLELQPDLVLVVGDVNSTLAAALAARKLLIPVAHVEAGLRSFDETMPEEINRRLTDALANLLFVSEPSGMANLAREGVDMARAHLVGDVMLETLRHFEDEVEACAAHRTHGLDPAGYALCTIHRPGNVDSPAALAEVLDLLAAAPLPTLLPLHPRTAQRLKDFGLEERLAGLGHVRPIPPQPYLEFLSLMRHAAALLSDSGSVQAEASYFDVPCLVLRDTTERPIYVEQGTTTLVHRDRDAVAEHLAAVVQGRYKRSGPGIRELSRNVTPRIADRVAGFLAG